MDLLLQHFSEHGRLSSQILFQDEQHRISCVFTIRTTEAQPATTHALAEWIQKTRDQSSHFQFTRRFDTKSSWEGFIEGNLLIVKEASHMYGWDFVDISSLQVADLLATLLKVKPEQSKNTQKKLKK